MTDAEQLAQWLDDAMDEDVANGGDGELYREAAALLRSQAEQLERIDVWMMLNRLLEALAEIERLRSALEEAHFRLEGHPMALEDGVKHVLSGMRKALEKK